jgi:hypothetical protein
LSWLRVTNPSIDWRSMSLSIKDPDTLLPIVAGLKDPANLRSSVMDPAEAEMDVLWQLAPWAIPVPPISNNPPKRSKTNRREDHPPCNGPTYTVLLSSSLATGLACHVRVTLTYIYIIICHTL